MADLSRRRLLNITALSAGALTGSPQQRAQPASSASTRRKWRTMYFNDARHFYNFSFEPPLTLEDAWHPIDEVAGTSVNTFIYGIESGGLFNDTKAGLRWGADQRPFSSPISWRAWYNIQSLID